MCSELKPSPDTYESDVENFYRKLARGTYTHRELLLIKDNLSHEKKSQLTLNDFLGRSGTKLWRDFCDQFKLEQGLEHVANQQTKEWALSTTPERIEASLKMGHSLGWELADEKPIVGLFDRMEQGKWLLVTALHANAYKSYKLEKGICDYGIDKIETEVVTDAAIWEVAKIAKSFVTNLLGVTWDHLEQRRKEEVERFEALPADPLLMSQFELPG